MARVADELPASEGVVAAGADPVADGGEMGVSAHVEEGAAARGDGGGLGIVDADDLEGVGCVMVLYSDNSGGVDCGV